MMLPELMMSNPLSYLPVGSTLEEQFNVVDYLEKVNLLPLIKDSESYKGNGFNIELNKLVNNKYFKVTVSNKETDEANLCSVIGTLTGEIIEENEREKTITLVYEEPAKKSKKMLLIKILNYLGDEILKVDILGDNSREKHIVDLKTFDGNNDTINIGDIPKNGFELRCNEELIKISRYISTGKLSLKEGLVMVRTLYREYLISVLKENDIMKLSLK